MPEDIVGISPKTLEDLQKMTPQQKLIVTVCVALLKKTVERYGEVGRLAVKIYAEVMASQL